MVGGGGGVPFVREISPRNECGIPQECLLSCHKVRGGFMPYCVVVPTTDP